MDFSGIFPTVFHVFDVSGVVVAGILGGTVARERHFDLVGFMALAVMAALGGGMIRDVLLQMGPPVALTSSYYLGGAFTGALIAFLLRLDGKWSNRFLIVADGFVLGAWTATGTLKALEGGFAVLPSIMMGVITAVGGGMVRDVAVGRVPSIFGGNRLYATSALAATVPAIILWEVGQPSIATFASTIVGGGLCIGARAFRWRLPVNNDYSLQKSYVRLRVALSEYSRARDAVKKSARGDASGVAEQDAALRELQKEHNSKNSGLLARSRRTKRERNQTNQ
ncbi:trimeric intracellular cation channel family protein [Actinomycetaceae bacterium L2_0104]